MRRAFMIVALALAIGLATAVSPWASASPDGLERVARDEGFAHTGKLHAIQQDAPVPGYVLPGVHDPRLATGLAGFSGTLVVFALGYGVARIVRRREPAA